VTVTLSDQNLIFSIHARGAAPASTSDRVQAGAASAAVGAPVLGQARSKPLSSLGCVGVPAPVAEGAAR
jgi:hypothetical protein